MKTILRILSTISLAASLSACQAHAGPLTVEPFTADGAGFHVTSTLVSGEKEAVLIDAQFTLSEAHKLTAQILKSGKELSRVYITHGHPDHYFGLEVIRNQFPDAKFLAHPDVIADMQAHAPGDFAQWKPLYGQDLTSAVIYPEAYSSETLELEGQSLRLIKLAPAEIETNVAVYVESARALITGDAVFSNVHVWLAETNAERRAQWLRNLDLLEELNPAVVIAGHVNPEVPATDAIAFTRQYITDVDQRIAAGLDADTIKAEILEQYPDLALPVILDIALQAIVDQDPEAAHSH